MLRLITLALVVIVGGCAVIQKPIVDLKAVDDPQTYQKDLIECVTLADYFLTSGTEMTRRIVRDSLLTGGGAVVSGAVMGSTSSSIATGMTAGLVGGAINASREMEWERNRGVGRCLQGRGYDIINTKHLWLDPRSWCGLALIGDWHAVTDEEYAVCIPAQEEWLRKAKEAKAAQRPSS